MYLSTTVRCDASVHLPSARGDKITLTHSERKIGRYFFKDNFFLFFLVVYLQVFRRCSRHATQFLAKDPHTPWKLAPWLQIPSSRPERRGTPMIPLENACWRDALSELKLYGEPDFAIAEMATTTVQSKSISDNCRVQQNIEWGTLSVPRLSTLISNYTKTNEGGRWYASSSVVYEIF